MRSQSRASRCSESGTSWRARYPYVVGLLRCGFISNATGCSRRELPKPVPICKEPHPPRPVTTSAGNAPTQRDVLGCEFSMRVRLFALIAAPIALGCGSELPPRPCADVSWDDGQHWLTGTPYFDPDTVSADDVTTTTLIVPVRKGTRQLTVFVLPENWESLGEGSTFFWSRDDAGATTATVPIRYSVALPNGRRVADDLSWGGDSYESRSIDDESYVFRRQAGPELSRYCQTDIPIATFVVE